MVRHCCSVCIGEKHKARSTIEYGGVAQLGERTVRIRKVESSILFVSIHEKSRTVLMIVRFFVLACTDVMRVLCEEETV